MLIRLTSIITVLFCGVLFSLFAQDPFEFGSTEDEPLFDETSESDQYSDHQNDGSVGTIPSLSTPIAGTPLEESGFQNAIIEGVQLTAEPGAEPEEKIVAGYFIFRDKPSSYFYEVKLKEKQLIFEFNDTKVGSSPVPTASEPPIKGFIIEQGKIDVNKAVKGLKPEWHDLIRVVFDLDAVPEVHVNDEYSIISFSFKWSTDPEKQAKYTLKDQTPKVILWSSVGVGGIALGVATYFILGSDKDAPIPPLSTDDLPSRPNPSDL